MSRASAAYMGLVARLEARSVRIPFSGCWIWTGATNGSGPYGRGGYGVIKGLEGKQVYAHRLSYQLFRGNIPASMFVCHICDVRSCINPEHLFVSDARGNHDDKMAKGRQRSPGALGDKNGIRKNPWLVRGENHPRSKLTVDQVRAIRAAHDAGEMQRDIAKRFSVGQSQVSRICRREGWPFV